MAPAHPTSSKPDYLSKSVQKERIFYDGAAPLVDGVAVICGGREETVADYRIDRESFPYFCVEWVASGKGVVALAGKDYAIGPGALFVYGPGVPHRIETDPRDRLVKFFVNFKGPRAAKMLKKGDLSSPCFRQTQPGAGVLEIFERLIEAGAGHLKSGPQVCRLLLESLVLIAGDQPSGESLPQGRAHQTYLRCRGFIETRFREVHDIRSVASACHVDPAYLTRVFRRYSGESPYGYLVRLKMKAAALHMVRHATLVKETADAFGYSDPYHFSKTFKRVHGMSPEAFLRLRHG